MPNTDQPVPTIDTRAGLEPLTRAVSDALDELLWRHHGIATSWSNPESFLKWLNERGYEVRPALDGVAMSGEPHDCESCADCLHDGHKCCGCYDGACCRAA